MPCVDGERYAWGKKSCVTPPTTVKRPDIQAWMNTSHTLQGAIVFHNKYAGLCTNLYKTLRQL